MAKIQSVKTSFASFALATNKRTSKAIQPIRVKTGLLIRGDLQKCIACKGIATIAKGKVTSFYPKSESYPHVKGCVNEKLF